MTEEPVWRSGLPPRAGWYAYVDPEYPEEGETGPDWLTPVPNAADGSPPFVTWAYDPTDDPEFLADAEDPAFRWREATPEEAADCWSKTPRWVPNHPNHVPSPEDVRA